MAVLFRHNFVTCLSGDVKPTADPAAGYGLTTGYRLFETDTNKSYFWSGGTWVELSAPSAATAVASDVVFGGTSVLGTSTSYAKADHKHGSPPVTINSTALNTVDFDDATPTAPLTSQGKATNVKWQHDALTPVNLSAYVYGLPLIVKSTAQTLVATSVLTSVAGLSFSLASARYYSFEYRLTVGSDTTTVGIQISLKTGAVNSSLNPFVAQADINVAVPGTGANFSGFLSSGSLSTAMKPLQFAPGTSAQPMIAFIRGNVFASNAVTLDVMIANETGTSTVAALKGSVGFLYDIGTS